MVNDLRRNSATAQGVFVIDIQKEAEKYFGETSDGKGVVTLADCIKFAESVRDMVEPSWLETCNIPPDQEPIILLNANGMIEQGFYDDESGYWFDSNWSGYPDPTHWMPLPELPEAE